MNCQKYIFLNFAWIGILNFSFSHASVPQFRTDQYWLEIAEKSKKVTDLNLFKREIEKNAGTLANQLNQDSHAPEIFSFWGMSQNHDELMKQRIVNENILDAILAWLGAPKRINEKIVNAGVEHTYGYLLSDLNTSFGYKRARWIKQDIEAGFNLTSGVLSPEPPVGTLFKNVTFFAGKIAFREDKQTLIELEKKLQKDVPLYLRDFDFKNLNYTRIEEEVHLAGAEKATILLRTDLVKFPIKKQDSVNKIENTVNENTYLLVYSVRDSRLNRPQLITLFPVTTAFYEKITDPTQLGDKEKIISRYNAFVSGVTDHSSPIIGVRKIVF